MHSGRAAQVSQIGELIGQLLNLFSVFGHWSWFFFIGTIGLLGWILPNNTVPTRAGIGTKYVWSPATASFNTLQVGDTLHRCDAASEALLSGERGGRRGAWHVV